MLSQRQGRHSQPEIDSCQESFGMSQPAAALSSTNMMNSHLFFCLSLSISFLLVALALACGKPVSLSPCYFVELFFIFCLRRLAFYKTDDREIALWNARMRIYFDAKWRNHESWFMIDGNSPAAISQICGPSICSIALWPKVKPFWHDCLGCHNLLWHSQLPRWWTHIFFFLHPYRSCSPATSSSTSSTWGRRFCHRTRAGDQEGWAGGTQHGEEELQPRTSWDREKL